MTQVLTKKMTREEYLEFERKSEERYEFANGELVEVEVAKAIHEILVNTIGSLLFLAMRGTAYQTLNSNVKIAVDTIGNYRYADLSVVKKETLKLDSDTLQDAIVIIEVLSDSTEMLDRVKKFREYQTLPSLQEYVLVSTERAQVEIFRRKTRNEWDYVILDDTTEQICEEGTMKQVLTKKMTREAYLEFERKSEERYEFANGELVERDMPKLIHEFIIKNLIVLIGLLLKGKPFAVIPSGVKISIDALGNYRYADVSIVPTENLDFESDILDNVVVLFEVSSETTMNIDKGEKFQEYQTLPSLQEYVLVSTERAQVEIFRRKTRNEWDYVILDDKAMKLELKSVGVEMTLAEIYDGTNL